MQHKQRELTCCSAMMQCNPIHLRKQEGNLLTQITKSIKQPDDETPAQEYIYKGTGEDVIQTCMTDIDLAEQIET
jgi:hypothetical protein